MNHAYAVSQDEAHGDVNARQQQGFGEVRVRRAR